MRDFVLDEIESGEVSKSRDPLWYAAEEIEREV